MGKKQGSGCLTIVGYVGAGLLALGILAAVFIAVYGPKITRNGMAEGLESICRAFIADMNLPQNEQDALLEPILELAADIRQERITLEQMENVGKETYKHDVIAAVGVPVFKSKYLEPSGLSPTEKQAGVLDLERFGMGLADMRITNKQRGDLALMLTEESPKAYGSNTNRALKKSLTDEEVRKCLKHVRDSAEEVNVPYQPYDLNPAETIRKAFARGKSE